MGRGTGMGEEGPVLRDGEAILNAAYVGNLAEVIEKLRAPLLT
jgi:hypothetical protein